MKCKNVIYNVTACVLTCLSLSNTLPVPYPFPLPFTPSLYPFPLSVSFPPSSIRHLRSAILVSMSNWRAASGGELLAGAYFPIEQMALQWSHTKLLLTLYSTPDLHTLNMLVTCSNYGRILNILRMHLSVLER